MILLLYKKDFNPEYLNLIEKIFEHGFRGNKYSIMETTEFSNIIIHNLELNKNPKFSMSFINNITGKIEEPLYNKVLQFINNYPKIMYIKN